MGLTNRVTAVIAVCLACWGFSPTRADAQNSELREMLKRVERMQRELSTLQQHVYRGTRPPALAPGAAAPPSGGADPRTVARLEVRLTQLENELRAVTGRVEEVQHGVTQIGKRLDKLVSDVDFRLAALERKSAESAQSEAGAAATPPPSKAATSQPSAAARGTKAIPPRNLGKIPRSAVTAKRTPVKPATTGRAAVASTAKGTPKQQYTAAIRLMQAQKFSDAERALRAFIDRNPKHALQPNAHYWLGETFYVRKDYQRAAYTFADSFQKYPEGNKAADSLLKLGMSLGRLGKKKEACTTFSRLLQNFPKATSTLKNRVARQRRSVGCG